MADKISKPIRFCETKSKIILWCRMWLENLFGHSAGGEIAHHLGNQLPFGQSTKIICNQLPLSVIFARNCCHYRSSLVQFWTIISLRYNNPGPKSGFILATISNMLLSAIFVVIGVITLVNDDDDEGRNENEEDSTWSSICTPAPAQNVQSRRDSGRKIMINED